MIELFIKQLGCKYRDQYLNATMFLLKIFMDYYDLTF